MLVDFILDYRSPYAYFANTQLSKLGAQIKYEPIDSAWVMKKVTNQPTTICPSKSKYAALDALRWAKQCGIPFCPNWSLLEALAQGHLSGNLFARAAIAAQQLGAFEQANDALFRLLWGNPDELTVVEGRMEFSSSSLSPKLWEMAESAEVKKKLAANNERAAARGVFGVPTFFVDDVMYFGNDRLRLDQANVAV